MSVTIRLDRPAVAALINDDPEFKYELQASVVSEMMRRFIDRDAVKIIDAAQPELMKAALAAIQENEEILKRVNAALNDRVRTKQNGYNYTYKLTDEMAKVVDEAIVTGIAKLSTIISVRAAEAIEAQMTTLDERIERAVTVAMNNGIAKVVNEKVAARMAAIAAAATGA